MTNIDILQRFTTKMSPEFRYAVRSEIRNTDDAAGHDLVKAVNSSDDSADGIETFSSFYRVAIAY